ncbi:ThiF family adenylyltransferase [Chitinophaga sp. MD30]|uniref:HesA/MoeB/ThiF family protein n=1 Tax=Chitinophaga sp. MD30 TaxID=2033437 RepID=UPI000BAF1CE8|nr:ThiF family adenylyltransferase [Chitinophaga sp. MD30]ASZ11229.1 hypothetical protein CK934_09760 [Chitinophaga sp. MD30]
MKKLKKYYPVWNTGKSICIGIPGTSSYFEAVATPAITSEIDRLIQGNGVAENEIDATDSYRQLAEKGMIEITDLPASTSNLLFFDYIGMPYNEQVFAKPILVFGAGAGGASIVYLLSQFGFKNITVVDDDKVSFSDVERTMVYRTENIGQRKVDALKEIIGTNFDKAIRTRVKVTTTYEGIDSLVSDVLPALVIKAADPQLSFRLHLNDVCVRYGIPFVSMAYAYEYLKVGPFILPGMTSCEQGINRQLKHTYGGEKGFEHHEKLYEKYTTHPSVSFNINILANLVLKDILFFFANRSDKMQSLGRQLLFNTLDFKAYMSDIPYCGADCICRKRS